jgi:deazaflavin-dependent oxidoreductase (nitroreductase family)
VIRAGSRFHTGLLRRFGRSRLIGGDALLLTTRGRKTGNDTSTPLFYARDADRLLVAASYAGSGVLPGWYRNLVAHPDVQVTTGGRTARYRARTLDEAEADAVWPKLLAVYPTFARYRRRALRTIPLVELRRSVGAAPPPRSGDGAPRGVSSTHDPLIWSRLALALMAGSYRRGRDPRVHIRPCGPPCRTS